MTELRASLRTRWEGLGLGAITLAWVQIEDVNIWYVVVIAALWCGWGAASLRRGKGFQRLWQAAGWGGLAGLAVTPLALSLVAVKGGLHGHGFSDLTVSQVRQLVGLSWWWVGGGAALGGLVGRINSEVK